MDQVPSLSRRANKPTPIGPFRFFDLPAELRLKIYKDLLTIKLRKGATTQIARHSAILRANKKCHNEGQPILERLNAIEIKVAAFNLVDGSPRDLTYPMVILVFAGGLQQTLCQAFENLPFSADSCYDVHQRWQQALQSGGEGGRLSVSLALGYHSISYAGAERLAKVIPELESQGMSHDSICDAILEKFKSTTKAIAAGHMSIAEVLQLAFALEHLALTPPHLPMRFVSAASGDYDRMMNRNHAYELMTTSSKPDAQFIRRLWALMSEWLPASAANFTTRILLPRHACRWNFRRDIRLLERDMSQLKGFAHSSHRATGGLSPPYTGPPVVWGLLPAVQDFLERTRVRHRQEGMGAAREKS